MARGIYTPGPTDRIRVNPDTLRLACELQRELSRLSDPAELVGAFVASLAEAIPIHRLLYVLPWPPPTRRFAWVPGPEVPAGSLGFRVLLDVDTTCPTRREAEHYRAMFDPRCDPNADGQGGFFGRILSQEEPICDGHLNLGADDPHLGATAGDHRSMMAVPIFWLGRVQAWIVAFSDESEAFSVDELRLLLNSGNMLARAAVHLDTLAETGRANARVQATLDEIGSVQRSLLPCATPDDPRVSLATSYCPSESSGGDYYDFELSGDRELDLIIADVSGHGPVAAVCVAMLRTAMRAHRFFKRPASAVVREVNHLMRLSLEPGMFVTAQFLSIDLETGVVRCVNCGHQPPIVRGADGTARVVDPGGGPPLGVLDDLDPEAVEFVLNPGDTLVLYTDGITECFNPAGELFGSKRLTSAVAQGGVDAPAIVDSIGRALVAHARHRPSVDDQTLVVVRFNGTIAASHAR